MKTLRLGRIYSGFMCLVMASSLAAQESHVGKFTGHASSGNDSYRRNCAGCHSASGNGKGTFAPYLDPRPRDFTAGTFKCRSSASGSLPTDQDLYDTLMRGIVTTAMPSWAALTVQNRVDMVAYIKRFSPRFLAEGAGASVPVPEETLATPAAILAGKQLYRKLECSRCHGSGGHGDGPDAGTLVDNKHQPDPPYDFTETSRYKCGQTDADLYLTFRTGMDGSPMKSYADQIDPEQTWSLVHYVRTLRAARSPRQNVLSRMAR